MSRIIDIQEVFENFAPTAHWKKSVTFDQWIEQQLFLGQLHQCKHCEEYFENEHDLDQYGICEYCREEPRRRRIQCPKQNI